MEIRENLKNIRKTAKLDEQLNEKIDKLHSRLTHFSDERISLNIEMEKFMHDQTYKTRLSLSLSPKILHAEEAHVDLESSVNDAFEALIRQVAKLKGKLSKGRNPHHKTR